MKQKKNKILIIAIIIVLILIICLSLVYVYIATDYLKSDKQLFFKYISQIVDDENGFIENELKQYYEKQKNTPYTNKGTFTTEINDLEEIFYTQIENVNNMNITFSGQVDNASSKMIQDISINYSDSVKFPFSFKKVQDTIGVQTKYVSKKYISTDIDQIGDLSTNSTQNNIGESTQNIEKIEDIFNSEILEEIAHIKDTYLEVLNQNIQENKFSKVDEKGTIGYKLSISSEEINDVLIKLLETLKNDQTTLDKINEYANISGSSNQITTDDIDDIIEELTNSDNSEDSEDIEQSNIEVAVYQKDGKTSKIIIKFGEINISIQKNKTENELQYNVSLEKNYEEGGKAAAHVDIKYEGLVSLQNINENYELGLEATISTDDSQPLSYKYNISNNVNFEEASNIEEFTESNSLNLNTLEEEQRNNFMNSLEQRITEVNKKQMEELGVAEDENPLIYINPLTYLYISIFNSAQNAITESINETEKEDISLYNAKFELYEGTNQGGGTVKGLLTTISQNNGLDDDEEEEEENQNGSNEQRLIKEINFNGEEFEVNKQTIALIKEEISIEDYFRVEFERDENSGQIFRVVISKK